MIINKNIIEKIKEEGLWKEIGTPNQGLTIFMIVLWAYFLLAIMNLFREIWF